MFRWMRPALEVFAVVAICAWLSPADTRTVFAAAANYARTTTFGPYDRVIYSQVQQRPFEVCPGIEARRVESLARVEAAIPGIESSSRFEPIRLFRLGRAFSRESRAFYASPCPAPWTYSFYFVENVLMVAPMTWIVDSLHGSEIEVAGLLIVGSWFGILSLFLITRRLSQSSVVGFVSLAVLWFSVSQVSRTWFGPGSNGAALQYVDFRLNLFNTFALLGIAQFLCELPSPAGVRRAWLVEISACCVFAVYALLLLFPRLVPTRLDAMVVVGSMFLVAGAKRNLDVFRRAVFLLVLVIAIQWPYQRFSASLFAPVSAVNSAAADEFKLVSAVQYLNERPTHFGNFILDYNNTWIHDGDYYLRRLSSLAAFHQGYPYWGRRFLTETVLHHTTELPNAWWKRFAVQVWFHRDLSYGIYGRHPGWGTAVFWLGLALGCAVVFSGRDRANAWPLLAVVFWEIFGLQTFLALMHVHYVYLMKGLVLLWCSMPCMAVVAVRSGTAQLLAVRRTLIATRPHILPVGRALTAAIAVALAAWWGAREIRKEIHVTHVWRAVHAGLIERAAFRTPDEVAGEIEAIRGLGGEGPGTVSMYGAWALFGYLERLNSYIELTGQPIRADHVKNLMFSYYKRGLAEGAENPHLYTYARYFDDPDWPAVYEEALRRFPDHPYRVMMTWVLATQAPNLPESARARYRALYETSVRAQLRDSQSDRPGYRPLPHITASGPVTTTVDGVSVSARPGEIVLVEPFSTFGTDRLALGLFLRVSDGDVAGQLVDAAGRLLGDVPSMSPADTIAYRAWRFERIDGRPPVHRGREDDRTARLELRAGPRGAQFVIRDLYPLVENPRWFR